MLVAEINFDFHKIDGYECGLLLRTPRQIFIKSFESVSKKRTTSCGIVRKAQKDNLQEVEEVERTSPAIPTKVIIREVFFEIS